MAQMGLAEEPYAIEFRGGIEETYIGALQEYGITPSGKIKGAVPSLPKIKIKLPELPKLPKL